MTDNDSSETQCQKMVLRQAAWSWWWWWWGFNFTVANMHAKRLTCYNSGIVHCG